MIADEERAEDIPEGAGQRTSVMGMAVGAVDGVRQMVLPIIALMIGTRNFGLAFGVGVGIAIAVLAITVLAQWLRWTRLQYFIGDTDIRVESGLLSLAKRSVPFERIQDVSLEQKLIPRLFGLVEVKFETGAGGKDELKLAYVTDEEGARLRELVRERQDDAAPHVAPDISTTSAHASVEEERDLFSMPPKRVFTFGLFEFSLVVFAALAGLAQQFDSLIQFDVYDGKLWRGLLGLGEAQLETIGRAEQFLGALAGLIGVIIIGIATGVLRTVLREWNFRLTRTAKGIRRRRGLLTKTDVLMPVHRVQAAWLGTGLIRRSFGWHSLNFVSLAQDRGSANHAVAPFARRAEIDPIASEADIDLSMIDLRWLRPAVRYWIDRVLIAFGFAAVVAAGAAIAGWPMIGLAIAGGIAVLAVLANWLGWMRHRFARDEVQIYVRQGLLAPQYLIAPQMKLQSVEIAQGPFGRWGGYCDLHFGLAGGTMQIEGARTDFAWQYRKVVLDRISQMDYSRIASARALPIPPR